MGKMKPKCEKLRMQCGLEQRESHLRAAWAGQVGTSQVDAGEQGSRRGSWMGVALM